MTHVRSSTLWCADKFIFADGDFLSVPAAIVIRPGGGGAPVIRDAAVSRSSRSSCTRSQRETQGWPAAPHPAALKGARARPRMRRHLLRGQTAVSRLVHAGAVLCPRQSRRIGAASRRLGDGRISDSLNRPSNKPGTSADTSRRAGAVIRTHGAVRRACSTPALERRGEAGTAERFDAEAPAGEAGALQMGDNQFMDGVIESAHDGEHRRNMCD